MSSDSFQYRALFEYKQERGDDISLQPGDLLTVSKITLLSPDYQEGEEKCPKGWLHGTNERTKEKGNFPGTFVEYVGVVRAGLSSGKPWPRPVPPTPVGPQPPGASASEGSCGKGDVVEQCALPDQAPAVVLRLTETLERQGWENEPLYRNAQASTGPPELYQALETDPAAVDFEKYELSILADTLRGYLQDLPCPLIPAIVYSELVYTAQETQSMEECGEQLRRILDSPSVPQANHQLLVHVTQHLSKVAQSGGAAQASPRLLALAYSEAIFKNNHFSADVNPEHHVKILEALILVGGLVEIQAAPELISSIWACAFGSGDFWDHKRHFSQVFRDFRGL
ncbi:phosphatidylinositol 3-kinase regulatory subunit alpha-like [Myxocyprinus asiaticus]|uniref:phosphatidylinositol 3-kinase regulatory subunit alpha-like n=1 Tax=Myxocyprinus asiaticus TaxID=70543 RepID=UPI002222E51C|nr:phosphatidylinositol 3-kinase regulatory subunit alpha-like [Myxocyprinus asiaticus]